MTKKNTYKKFDFALLWRVLQYAKPYKNKFYLSVFLAILLAAFTPLRPLLIQLTVDRYIAGKLVNLLIGITFFQIGFILLETILRFYFSYLTAWLGQNVVKDLRVKVYEKALSLNLSQFDKTPIGTLTTRTVDDIERINDVFSDGLIPILADLLSIICVLSYMFWQDASLSLIALIPFPILLAVTYYFKESIKQSFHRVRNAVAQLNAFVQEHLSGMQVVQVFAAEEKELQKFKQINEEHRKANVHAIFAYSVFFPIVEIVLATSIGLIVWWTSKEALHLQQSQQGTLLAFILCLNLIFRPLRVIADKFNVLQMGMVAGERVFKLLDNDDVLENSGTFSPEKIKGKIDFEKVSFGYSSETPIIKDISFSVQPGETVALVGHTGSGKSTIIQLLNRLYTIQKGVIKVDDVPIEDYDVRTLRQNMGIVLQEVFLFSSSIRENITLRNTAISQEQIETAAKLIGLHPFIKKLPGGYDFNVMERGSLLSFGQRQLLSFVRAVLYNPSILILDEATSSVDSESEQLIQNAIEKLVKGRTAIVIAHRLSTIQKANKIIVLENGEIKETGTHQSLLQLKGHYYKLYQLQFEKHPVVH